MNVLVVIQARLGSTRLPGKVLLPLGPDNKPVLQHVVERAQQAGYPVVVACPDADTDALLSAVVGGVKWQDGIAENDVLARYAAVVGEYPDADIIVRLTADCPVLDPALIVRAVEAIKAGHDYAGNTVERHWPRGLDVEAFTTELLQQAHELASDPYDREHVTPWMQRHAVNPKALVSPVDRSMYRWCLDTPSDLLWLQRAFQRFPDPSTSQLLTLPPRYD